LNFLNLFILYLGQPKNIKIWT